jgi:basic amino acid/polyamine antiporter, APA family
VARRHRCESLLLGLSQLSDDESASPLDELMSSVDCDIVVLRAPQGWQLDNARSILVPTGGRGGHDRLLARLLSSFSRSTQREITLLRVLPEQSSDAEQRQTIDHLAQMGNDLCFTEPGVLVLRSDNPVEAIAGQADQYDLTVLGIQRVGRRQKLLSQFAAQVARRTECPMLLIGSSR